MRKLKKTEIKILINLNKSCDKKQVKAFLTNLNRFKDFNEAEGTLLYLDNACKWSESTKTACEGGIHVGQFPFGELNTWDGYSTTKKRN